MDAVEALLILDDELLNGAPDQRGHRHWRDPRRGLYLVRMADQCVGALKLYSGELDRHIAGLDPTVARPQHALDILCLQWILTLVAACARGATPSHPLQRDLHDARVRLSLTQDGIYTILVHGYHVPTGQDTFDLTIDAIQGNDITVSNLPTSIPAGGSATITISWSTAGKAPGVYKGLIVMGPNGAPTLFKVPIIVTVL